MNEIFTRLVELPESVSAFTIRDQESDYNIYLNCRLSHEKLLQAYKHELQHIERSDYCRGESVDLIEIYTHKLF